MSWSQRMAAARRRASPAANSANSAERPPDGATAAPIGTNGTIGTAGMAATELAPEPGPGAFGTNGTIGSGLTARSCADPAGQIAAYHERMAIITADAPDVPEAEAHRIATGEAGAGLDTLAGRQVAAWRARIGAMAQADSRALARLRRDLQAILGERWALEAARLGWDDVAVLGVHPVAPLVRIECWGLAVALALCPHNRGQARARVVAIEPSFATIALPTGVHTRAGRFARGLDVAVPVWSLPAFTPSGKH